MKKYFASFLVLIILIIGISIPIFAEGETLGYEDDTIYVRVVKYRYDRSFPSTITHTESRGSRKFRGRISIDWGSVRRENDNRYSAVYEGTLYDVGYARSLLNEKSY